MNYGKGTIGFATKTKCGDSCLCSRYKYDEQDYEKICKFFIQLNEKKQYMNWNYARFEWGFRHPEFDDSLLDKIGVWKDNGQVVGIAVYDMFLGEAFCGALKEYNGIMPEILDYAASELSDENGVGIAVNCDNKEYIELLEMKGFVQDEQTEQMLCLSLEQELDVKKYKDLYIHEIQLPSDKNEYQFVIWQGFDHDSSDQEGFKEYYAGHECNYPHMNPTYTLVAVNEKGEYIAHCGCWYLPETDYAYVEPLCVIPEYRNRGIGKNLLFEVLNRCRRDGAKEAYVLSNNDFYLKAGFQKYSKHTFYWKK